MHLVGPFWQLVESPSTAESLGSLWHLQHKQHLAARGRLAGYREGGRGQWQLTNTDKSLGS